MTERRHIGRMLRQIRDIRELTQQDVSELTGLDQGFISRFELQTKNPTIYTLIDYSKGVDVHPAVIMWEISKHGLTPEQIDRQRDQVIKSIKTGTW